MSNLEELFDASRKAQSEVLRIVTTERDLLKVRIQALLVANALLERVCLRVANELDDRYDYATDTGESPWQGAGELIQELRRALSVAERAR